MNALEKVAASIDALKLKNMDFAKEPPGEKKGLIEVEGGEQRPLSCVAVGDSMVLGCGCSNTRYGLVPQFLRLLSRRMNRNVEWELVGKFGATLTRARYRMLPSLEGRRWDMLILCAGSNDLMAFRPADEKWQKELKDSIEMAKAMADRVIVFSSAEVYMVPAFGRSLQERLKRATLRQAEVAQKVCDANGALYINQTVGTPYGDTKWFWCSDCFHPSYEGYRVIANCLISHFSDSQCADLASLGLEDCRAPKVN
ncbi:MAG: SGNH/GDSL hydrolase family protein [Aeriscardovia sp.]|nr:SGNH/GDSL hydrolase family protein [Aeriscardovia sp.]